MDHVYKVVKVYEQNKFCSYTVYVDAKVRVEYALGKTSRPRIRGSYLFAFLTERHARKFAEGNGRILYCKAEVAQLDKVIYEILSIYDGHLAYRDLLAFWKRINGLATPRIRHDTGWLVPFGTVFCKSITPIRIVS